MDGVTPGLGTTSLGARAQSTSSQTSKASRFLAGHPKEVRARCQARAGSHPRRQLNRADLLADIQAAWLASRRCSTGGGPVLGVLSRASVAGRVRCDDQLNGFEQVLAGGCAPGAGCGPAGGRSCRRSRLPPGPRRAGTARGGTARRRTVLRCNFNVRRERAARSRSRR
ncbi:MAG: hypothetical protein M0C28_36685 [Candidatus Moduliflexus flocculans]|nr:hypothetical protein [Candidatus Moduliflexus flocculans]